MVLYVDSFNIDEWLIYGSSRLGTCKGGFNLAYRKIRINETGNESLVSNSSSLNTNNISFQLVRGFKKYELTNHLGNVLTVVSDCKIPVCSTSTFQYYTADVLAATDYSPFGAPLPGRTFTLANTNYRFGFNGKEKDNDVKGSGNSYDFGARIYDPRLGRFNSNDPRFKDLPSWSPYMHALDNPISVLDEDGKWPKWIHNRIIKMAFKGILTKDEIKILQKASAFTDNKPGAQTPENSAEHYMSKPGQTPTEAKQKSEEFIKQKKEEYKGKEGEEALTALGEGMHTEMDGTSPAHAGSQEWGGMQGITGKLKGLVHLSRELNLFHKDEDKVLEAADKIKTLYYSALYEKSQKKVEERQNKEEKLKADAKLEESANETIEPVK